MFKVSIESPLLTVTKNFTSPPTPKEMKEVKHPPCALNSLALAMSHGSIDCLSLFIVKHPFPRELLTDSHSA